MTSDEIRIACWNIEHNGRDSTGSDARWRIAMDVLAALAPHIVLRQELTGAAARGGRALWAEADRLGGLHPFMAAETPESPNPTVLVDSAWFRPEAYYEHRTGVWHPICNPVVRLKGTGRPLSLASFHLCSHDPDQRVHEARRLMTLGKPGMATILGGDGNSYPHDPAEAATLPVWEEVEDRPHFECRTIPGPNGRVCDTRPDEILAGSHGGRPPVFVDLAQYTASVRGQTDALAPTASLWRRDQGPRQRIDRMYATPQVAAALTSLEVIATDEVIKASDHALLLARFSASALREVLSPTPESASMA